MFFAPLLLSLLQAPAASVAPPAAAPVSASRHPRRLFISPMGEPFRSKSREDDTLADWFAQADQNHDGRLTLEEMQADAQRFFALLDLNHDGEIDPDEVTHYEDAIAPEVRTGEHFSLTSFESNAPEAGAGRGSGRRRGDSGRRPSFRGGDDPHQGAGRFGLLDLPEPVVSADSDFNRGISLTEFRQAAVQRFLALDLDHHGFLSLAGLESIRPAPPPAPNAPEKTHQVDESALPQL